MAVIDKAGIRLSDLPDLPLIKLRGLLSVPIDEGAVIFSHIMQELSKEPLYGSILQSIKRGKATEIDYLNGEIVELGKRINQPTPYNSRAVEVYTISPSLNPLPQGRGELLNSKTFPPPLRKGEIAFK